MNMRISKSKIRCGLPVPQAALLASSAAGTRRTADAAAEAIIQQGHEVGMLARTLFPGGVEVRLLPWTS